MHFAAILSAIVFSGAALSTPVRRSQSVQLQDFNADISSNETVGTLQFTVQSGVSNLTDSCHLSWNPTGEDQPSMEFNKCAQDNFQFGFRYGLQIENFMLDLQQVKTQQTVYQVFNSDAKNSKWVCTKNPKDGVKESCQYNGVLDLRI